MILLDHGFTPRVTVAQSQIFYAAGATGALEWQSWVRPRNISFVLLRLMGPGSGGGGGMSGAAGTARGGGGGGGAGGIVDLLIPASLLPDVLYIMVGRGGLGGAAASNGTQGERTYVSLVNNSIISATLIACASTVNAIHGSPGTAGGGGAGGAGGTASTANLAQGHNLGLFTARAGQAGGAGGAHTGAIGTAVTFGSGGLPITGGAGGGGTNTANTDFGGGAITGAGMMPTIAGGLAAAGRGQDGISLSGNPMWGSTGGSGGGTAGAAGVGGDGGNGGYGSGGGGGGGGVTGGNGGRGGDGLVLLSCW